MNLPSLFLSVLYNPTRKSLCFVFVTFSLNDKWSFPNYLILSGFEGTTNLRTDRMRREIGQTRQMSSWSVRHYAAMLDIRVRLISTCFFKSDTKGFVRSRSFQPAKHVFWHGCGKQHWIARCFTNLKWTKVVGLTPGDLKYAGNSLWLTGLLAS